MVHLINLTVLPPGNNTPQILRFCSGVPGFRTSPAESPANAVWLPGVVTPYHFSREMFGGTNAGASKTGYGEIVLANNDGHLDYLDADAWAIEGQLVEVLAGEDGGAYADFETVFFGVVKTVEFTWATVTLNVRDRQEELAEPLAIIPAYLGTNSGATGIEGTADDIKGASKPLSLGRCFNVTPVCVNSSADIYQVHFRQVQAIPAVYSNGAALTLGADYANETLLAAASITAGTYATCLAKGLFRLQTTLNTVITADVQGDAVGGYVATTGACMRRVLEMAGWAAGGDFVAADFTTLDTAQPAEVGVYDTDGGKAKDLLDELAAGAWAWYCPDRLGIMRVGRVAAPSGSPVAAFSDVHLMGLERVTDTSSSGLAGAPWSVVTLDCAKNYTKQDGNNVAGVVTDARRAWLAAETRTATSTSDGLPSPAVTARYPLAIEQDFKGLLTTAAAAVAEAQRRAAFRLAVRRSFKAQLAFEFADGLDLGAVVSLTSRRLGLADWRGFISSIEDVPEKSYVEITING